ncbi:MAG: sugar phosphate isomerase/epimerase [Clostridiales bacterium]|nr:sugar phosphate isomerase/epimerase [Clostridiales bacterium]
MKYGLHKMTWGSYFDPNDISTFFSDAARAGAQTIEFRPPDAAMEGNTHEICRLRRLADENHLDMVFCLAYPAGIDMRSADRSVRRKAVEYLKQGIYTAKELGGLEIGGVLYSQWPTNYGNDMLTKEERYDRRQRCLEGLREAMILAEEIEMPVNLEVINRYEGYTVNTVAEGLALCEEIGSRFCNLLLDVFHMNIEEDDICAAIRSAAGRIGHFHVSEPNRMLPWHTARIDWPKIGRTLRSIGYDKAVTIEAVVSFDGPSTYNMRMWRDLTCDADKEARINTMRKGLAYIREQFEQSD